MRKLQLRTFIVLLTVGLGASAAWSSQDAPATSALEPRANLSKDAPAQPGNNAGAANGKLPGILPEDEIPAYLITDPCDTQDS
jgi:hypothetical protein